MEKTTLEMSAGRVNKCNELVNDSPVRDIVVKLLGDRSECVGKVQEIARKKLTLLNPNIQSKLLIAISCVEYIDILIDYLYTKYGKEVIH